MKRLFALLVALMLTVLPALADINPVLDYNDDIMEDGSPVYYFQELALHLPADWAGKVIAMPAGDGVSFYQRASYEKYQDEGLLGGGFLFSLGASVDAGFSQLPAFRYLGFSEDSNMNYFLALPTDYPPYNETDIRAEYDAMCNQVEYVWDNVEFYPYVSFILPDNGAAEIPDTPVEMAEDGLAQQAEAEAPAEIPAGEESEAQAGGITLQQARYHFEHSALPRYFYMDPANMLDVLGEVGVYQLWTSLADENGVKYPYQASDYRQNLYTGDGGVKILQIVMPEPDANTLCYRVYMVYNPETGNAGYYTVEYDDFLGVNSFICTWDAEGTHAMLDGAAILNPADAGYEAALAAEAEHIAAHAGENLSVADGTGDDAVAVDEPEPVDDGLELIACPELGFSTKADPAYAWDYKDGTGISIYTESEGKIPYVIVWRSEDLYLEPYELICEQYTPHMRQSYGDDLVSAEEVEHYEIGGKDLPAGLYTYRLQGHLVDMVRIYDSTGSTTVAFTAKYLQGESDATLAALDAAVRNYKED